MANKISPSLALVSLVLTGVFQLVAQAAAESTPRPNIVLIYADDLGYADLGCYGNEYHETPRIDALVSRGIRFTQAYSGAPLCAPSRIALFTGRHCARAGSFETVNGRWNENKFMLRASDGAPEGLDLEWEKKVDFDMPRNSIELPRDRKTIAEYLKEAGYFTGFVGKWHMGSQKPTNRGFDEYAQIETYRPGANLDTSKGRSSRSLAYPEPQGHIGDYMARSAIQFIDRSGDRPFFLYMAHPLPHTPHEAEPSLIRKYTDQPASVTHSNPIYAAMIEMLDESVGKVIATLRERGALDDTLVIFTSDNGAMQGPVRESPELGGYELGNVTTNYPLRGGKVQLWEGGIRIPMAIVFGDRFAATDFDGVVSQMDILPTLLDLAKHPDAANADELFDGKSLMPILWESSRKWEDRSLFWHYPGYRGLSLKPTPDGRRPGFVQRPATMVRHGDWKLHQSLETGDVRLYDLGEDIGERNNVADRHPDVVRRLEAQIAAWQKETDAPMPIPKQGAEKQTARQQQSDELARPVSSASRRESPESVVRVQVDFAQECGKIPRNVSGMLTDPPRSYNYMMNPNAGKTGRDNPRIEVDKENPSGEGMNAVWLENLRPSIAGLGWGGDVWYVYDPWPAEGVYDWNELDQWIESHLARGTDVALKFSLVPRWLWSEHSEEQSGAAQQFFPYLKKGHVMPPSDYGKWEELVYQTVRHLNIEKKYNVRFEPWNEPNARFWLGTQQEHLEMYERTAKAIRRADPQALIGGPTLTSVRRNWLEPFLKHCAENDVPLDFISWHYYLWHGLQAGHVQSFTEQAAEVRSLLAQYPSLGQPGLCVSEWAYMWYLTEMPSPTFNAAFTLQSFYEMLEGGIDTAYYCGPLGPVKSPDPAVNAFMMYNALDKVRVNADINGKDSSVGVLATKGPKSMSILLWNYPFDAERVSHPRTPPETPPRQRQEFHQKRTQSLSDMVADEMQKPPRQVEVVLENLLTESCTYEQYVVDAEHCSQLMEKVDEGRFPAQGGPQIRIALEPYGLTMIKLTTD